MRINIGGTKVVDHHCGQAEASGSGELAVLESPIGFNGVANCSTAQDEERCAQAYVIATQAH